jgi:hypothetical protein
MPLSFSGIYLLTSSKDPRDIHTIAMAPRVSKPEDAESDKELEWQFLIPNPVRMAGEVRGTVHKDTPAAFEVEDRNGRIWTFKPLTIEAWNKMGANGSIDCWMAIRDSIKSTDDLLQFYHNDWVRPCSRWWYETAAPTDAAKE